MITLPNSMNFSDIYTKKHYNNGNINKIDFDINSYLATIDSYPIDSQIVTYNRLINLTINSILKWKQTVETLSNKIEELKPIVDSIEFDNKSQEEQNILIDYGFDVNCRDLNLVLIELYGGYFLSILQERLNYIQPIKSIDTIANEIESQNINDEISIHIIDEKNHLLFKNWQQTKAICFLLQLFNLDLMRPIDLDHIKHFCYNNLIFINEKGNKNFGDKKSLKVQFSKQNKDYQDYFTKTNTYFNDKGHLPNIKHHIFANISREEIVEIINLIKSTNFEG